MKIDRFKHLGRPQANNFIIKSDHLSSFHRVNYSVIGTSFIINTFSSKTIHFSKATCQVSVDALNTTPVLLITEVAKTLILICDTVNVTIDSYNMAYVWVNFSLITCINVSNRTYSFGTTNNSFYYRV